MYIKLDSADHQPTGRLKFQKVSDWTIRVRCAWDRLKQYAD